MVAGIENSSILQLTNNYTASINTLAPLWIETKEKSLATKAGGHRS
jgi:hypothetical protein